jgi:hypothetical protein
MSDIELKPFLIALLVNIVIVYALPRLFANPTGFKAFDDFVSYLKAQQAFIGFSSSLLIIVLYLTTYYLKNYDESGTEHYGEIMTESFSPSPRPHKS